MRIEFGEWLPDQPSFANPGCIQAKNVVPRIGSFSQFRGLQAFSSALTSACIGSVWMPDANGAAVNFAGDASTKLYKYTSSTGTWTNVSRTASYSTAVQWSFGKFGDRCIAVDVGNLPQYYDLASSTTFQNLAGSPPQAKYIATVRDFLVLAHLSGAPNRVRWSGFNNSELWTSSLATQSDFQDFPGMGGPIQGIVPGEYGVIFQQSSIWKMTYVGPPTVFRFDEVERGKGTSSPKSICWYGPYVFYYDVSGFHRFDGAQSVPIGHEKVDAWFNQACADPLSVQGAVDRANRLVMWGFKSTGAVDYNDRVIIYNFAANKWAWGEVETQWISERVSEELTLDQLDTPLPGGIDIDSIPMDSQFFSTDLTLQAFNWSNQSGSFEGSPLTAVLETRDVAIEGHAQETSAVRPLVDGGSVMVRLAKRDGLASTATYSNSIGLNRLGEASKVCNSRFQRFELTITGGFDFAQGVETRTRRAGKR